MVSFYALCWEIRILKVKLFDKYKCILMEDREKGACAQAQDYDAIIKCIENVEMEVNKLREGLGNNNNKIKELEGALERLHGNCLLEAAIYESAIVEKVNDFVNKSKNIKLSKKKANTPFKEVATLILLNPRNLPNLPVDEDTCRLLKEYRRYSHLDEIRLKFEDCC